MRYGSIISTLKMSANNELDILSGRLREIFIKEVFPNLKGKNLTDRNLDEEVYKFLKDYHIFERGLEINFSEPKDTIYKTEGGRTPYDLLCYGKVKGKDFNVFINNKLGDLKSSTRNDVTTYNNLLRLYLGVSEQRLTSKVVINRNLIYKRVSGEEIVSYGIFVVDKYKNGANFFLLEEIQDEFYVNPIFFLYKVDRCGFGIPKQEFKSDRNRTPCYK